LQYGAHTQKSSKIVGVYFQGGGGKIFLTPYISPNFGYRGLNIKGPLNLHGPHLRSEFCDLTLQTRRGETIVEIKKFAFFDKRGVCKIRSFLRISWIDEFFKWNIV